MSQKNSDTYAFLKDLQGISVTDGWDVVIFISAKAINKLWNDRWNQENEAAYKGDKQFLQTIDATFKSTMYGTEITRHLTMDLLAPLLILKPHDKKNVNIKIPIKTADLVSTWNGKTETNHYESTPDSPCYLLTECALESLNGSVDKNGGVFIDAFKGTFNFEGITFDPILDANICNCIAEYVKKQNFPSWFLGTIKYQATEEYLKPKNFSFTTYCHKDNSDLDVLGIYILTTKDEPPSTGMRISWKNGWVIGNKCNTAVYFSSHLLWEKEIEPAFEQNFGPMSGKGTDSPNRTFTNGIELCTVEVTVKISQPCSVKHETLYPSVTLPGSQINLNLDLFELKLSCDASWNESFPYQKETRAYVPPGEVITIYDKAVDDLKVTCKFETSVAPSINQETFEISFPNIQIDPDITAEKPDHGFFWPSGNEIKDTIINRAKGFFSKVNIQLKTMSMFAVSNILFPEGKMLTPEKVAFPRDMVIVGTASEEYKPINKA